MTTRRGPAGWSPGEPGVLALPSGLLVRGRRLRDDVGPAEFTLVLGGGHAPAWAHRRLTWPDLWVPTDPDDAVDALHETYLRLHHGERAEVACRGGIGRTGTALAALVVLDGTPPDDAVRWVRARHHPRAVETPWQRRWLRRL